jgi:hypothetical protein
MAGAGKGGWSAWQWQGAWWSGGDWSQQQHGRGCAAWWDGGEGWSWSPWVAPGDVVQGGEGGAGSSSTTSTAVAVSRPKRGRVGPANPPSEPEPEGQWVYSLWPWCIYDYPKTGEEGSFTSLQEMAVEMGCRLRLAGKHTQSRPTRRPTLTVKGPRAFEVFCLVMPIDTRVITDPARRLAGCHVGYSGDIMWEFVKHPDFNEWLGRTMDQICRALGDVVPAPQKHVCLAVYCKSGMHRSVAGGIIIQHVLQATVNSIQAKPLIQHTSRPFWSRYCGGCQECRAPSQKRDRALFHARAVWRWLVATS